MNKTVQERIEEIVGEFTPGDPEGLLRIMLEALVIQAQLEQLQSK